MQVPKVPVGGEVLPLQTFLFFFFFFWGGGGEENKVLDMLKGFGVVLT